MSCFVAIRKFDYLLHFARFVMFYTFLFCNFDVIFSSIETLNDNFRNWGWGTLDLKFVIPYISLVVKYFNKGFVSGFLIDHFNIIFSSIETLDDYVRNWGWGTFDSIFYIPYISVVVKIFVDFDIIFSSFEIGSFVCKFINRIIQ